MSKVSLNLETDLYDSLKRLTRKLSVEQDKTITLSDLIRNALLQTYGEQIGKREKP